MPNATGSGSTFALGFERRFGIPGLTPLRAYRAILPIEGGLAYTESESGAVNPTGMIERSVPGPIEGSFNFNLPLKGALLLEFLRHLFGDVNKTEPEAGIFKYVFELDPTVAQTTFYGLLANVVERRWLYALALGGLEMEIGDNEEVPVALSGEVGHGTRMGLATAEVGNTGTYALGPWLRGPLKTPENGDVWVRITSVAPLQFKCQQAAALPAFAGAAVDVLIDPETLEGTWQNLQGHNGFDLGIWDESRDPLEIVWPGAAADHANLDVGDTWRFAVPGWEAPALVLATGSQALTSAHWIVKLRKVGSPTWLERRVNEGTIGIEWELTPDRGSGGRYPFGMTRDGQFTPTLALSRKLVDTVLAGHLERRERLEVELSFLGAQLGAGVFRDSIVFRYPSMRIDERTADPSDPGAVVEEVSLTGETNDALDPSLTVEVVTARDWTVI